MRITFHFDPLCPWTWRASRWLVQTAASRDLNVQWRALSLYAVNDGKVPEGYLAPALASHRALRLVESLHADARAEDAGRFYTELGRRTHEVGVTLTEEITLAAAEAAGLTDKDVAAVDDESWESGVRASTDMAIASAGPDVGSPVLLLEGAQRGLHGPILSAVPEFDEGLTLWDAIVPLLRSTIFFEVKRGRR
jgi:2-hydroxychromene-2-carboxylate isomerase